jgi:putative glutamine amidotransferase
MGTAGATVLIRPSPRARRRRSRTRPEKPLIGVTTSEVRSAEDVRQIREGEPPRHEMSLGLTYMRTIELAGGIPVVLPPLRSESIDPLLDQVAGLCLSGGPDLDPKTYSRRADPHLGPVWPELDATELAVARAADERELPLLAICRGMQALNVARGGTLHQHLPDDGEIRHRQDAPAHERTHAVRVERESRLGSILRRKDEAVNSFHHQAVDDLGQRLRPVAWAPDGVIEAIEDDRREFLIGVQWHAECLADAPEHLEFFKAFVRAADSYRD